MERSFLDARRRAHPISRDRTGVRPRDVTPAFSHSPGVSASGELIRAGTSPVSRAMQFTEPRTFDLLALGVLAAALALSRLIETSRLGYWLRAIRENEQPAEAAGVDSFRCNGANAKSSMAIGTGVEAGASAPKAAARPTALAATAARPRHLDLGPHLIAHSSRVTRANARAPRPFHREEKSRNGTNRPVERCRWRRAVSAGATVGGWRRAPGAP
jgi:Branched-chain amino acid transport system / permease component